MPKTTQTKIVKITSCDTKLILPTVHGMVLKKAGNISFFKSDDIYCMMNDINGNSCFISKSLKWIEVQLSDENFYRVHNCYIINIYNIAEYRKQDGSYLIMECGTKIPISRSRRFQLTEFLRNGSFLEGAI